VYEIPEDGDETAPKIGDAAGGEGEGKTARQMFTRKTFSYLEILSIF
jgi:hypothetical protein